MAIPKLTLDQDAQARIVELHKNVRERLASLAGVFNDGVTVIYTAVFVVAAPNGISLGSLWVLLTDFETQYTNLDTSFTSLYATYAASQWKTDITAAKTALAALKVELKGAADANYTAVNPAAVYLIKELSAAHKTWIAGKITAYLG